MHDGKPHRRRAGVIGAAVAVATAGVVVLVATADKPEDEPVRPEPPRQLAAPTPPATLPPPPPPAPPSNGTAKPTDKARQAGILDAKALQDGAFASLTGTANADIYGGLVGTGRGWGPGSGGGLGLGGGTGRANGPEIRFGQPVVASPDAAGGELDKAIVRRYLKRNAQKLRYCYEKELLVKPALAGTVSAGFTILTSGNVDAVTSSGVDPRVASCIKTVLDGILYPRPKNGGAVTVRTAFTFRPK